MIKREGEYEKEMRYRDRDRERLTDRQTERQTEGGAGGEKPNLGQPHVSTNLFESSTGRYHTT